MKMKNANKKRTVTARRLIFWEFLKASIADLISLLFLSLQISEGGVDSDRGDSCADLHPPPPYPIFTISEGPRLSFTFETFGKKLAETKTVAMVKYEENQSKKYRKKTFKSPAMTQQFFTKICQL